MLNEDKGHRKIKMDKREGTIFILLFLSNSGGTICSIHPPKVVSNKLRQSQEPENKILKQNSI